MALRKILERIHLSRDAEGVNRKDGAGARRDCAFNGRGFEIERDGIDLDEDRRRAHLKHRVDHGYEGKRGDDDLVALAHPQSEQSQMEARGAGTDGDGVGDAVVGGQLRFKSGEFRTQAKVRRAQNGGDCIDLGLGNVGRGEWECARSLAVPSVAASAS